MKRVIAFATLSLAICGLLLAPIASAKDPVQRPTHIKASGVLVLNIDGSASGEESGIISHGGRFNDEWDTLAPGTLAGTVTVANGDQYFWEGPVELFPNADFSQIDFDLEVNVTGGTGRFEGATGQLKVQGTAVSTGTPGVYAFSYAGGGYLSY